MTLCSLPGRTEAPKKKVAMEECCLPEGKKKYTAACISKTPSQTTPTPLDKRMQWCLPLGRLASLQGAFNSPPPHTFQEDFTAGTRIILLCCLQSLTLKIPGSACLHHKVRQRETGARTAYQWDCGPNQHMEQPALEILSTAGSISSLIANSPLPPPPFQH